MTRAFLALGANQGDRAASLAAALARIEAAAGVALLAVAGIRETAPQGPAGQGMYLNTVCAIETGLSAMALLRLCQEIEKDLGRDRSREPGRWGPRPIDLDLLLYGEEIIDAPGLRVPHREMHLRRFVLEPLAEIAPTARHPLLGATAAGLLARLEATEEREP